MNARPRDSMGNPAGVPQTPPNPRGHSLLLTALRALPLLVVVVVFGCSQVLGADDYAVAPPVVCGDLTSLDDEAPGCSACLHQKCCARETACAGDTGCAAALACFADCANSTCLEGCIPDGDKTQTAINDILECRTNCRSECAMGQHWSCAGNVSFPSDSGVVEFRLLVEDIATLSGVPGVVAQACDITDFPCASPAATATSDANGVVALTVSQTRPFYVSLAKDDYLPSLYFGTDPPLRTLAPGVVNGTVLMVTPMVESFAASEVNLTVMPDKGQFAFAILDCLGDLAPGVSVSLATPAGTFDASYYLENSVPTSTALETDVSGLGAIVNVPPGLAVVTARVRATGQFVGRTGILLRANTVTSLRMGPTSM